MVDGTTATRCRLSRGMSGATLMLETWFSGDDNAGLTATVRYKLTSDPDQVWVNPGGGWRTGLPLWRQENGDSLGRMMINFIANLTGNTSYDVEVTLTDADGVTATSVPLYTDDVTVGNATIVNTSGTVKKWTITTTTRVATLAVVGAVTHYISPSGNDTTGDGSSGTPWRSGAKAWASAPSGAVVRLAAGEYTYWPMTSRATPITFVAEAPAVTVSTPTVSGEARTKPAAANAGSRAVIVPTLVYTPTGSGLPNAGQWTEATLTGPATGGSFVVWKLAGLFTFKVLSVMYGATATGEQFYFNKWDVGNANTFTPASGPYAGLTFGLNTAARWAEIVHLNDTYNYGWAVFGTTPDIYAKFPNGVDPNTQYVYIGTYEDGAGFNLQTAGVRFSGLEFRIGVAAVPGLDGGIMDRCLLTNAPFALYATTPGTRGQDLILEECVSVMRRSVYDPDPAQETALAPWWWIKSEIWVSGASASSVGWNRLGGLNEIHAIGTTGGVRRVAVRRCLFDGWFNGFAGYSPNFDRFVMYQNEVYDNWWIHIADDVIEPEQAVCGLLAWRNIVQDSLTFFSIAPANYGPILVAFNQVDHLTFEGWGGPTGTRGGALYGIKYGLNHDYMPEVYYWHNTVYVSEAGSDGGGQSNNGGGAQTGPYFHFRNNLARHTRYALQEPNWADEDYNDYSTTDLTRGVNVGSSNKVTIGPFRAALINPVGLGANTNTRAESFHVDPTSEWVDAAGGDFRLAAGSDFLAGGIAVPYWDRPGIDFAGAVPDLGAVQQTSETPPPAASRLPVARSAASRGAVARAAVARTAV